ncbi:MAG: calcium/sodium antiporter [Planctomycetota bacterium]|jgi:cation:H+ antiporter
MNTTWAVVLLLAGLIILWKAADLLVAGAVVLAERLGISPLVIGLTIVAMGTSAPEVAASIAAVLEKGGGNLAVGNVYGSNIANLALIGGLAALIRPTQVQLRVLKREIPVMLVVALLLWPALYNLRMSREEGVGLLALFAALIIITGYLARREGKLAAEITPLASSEPDKTEKRRSLTVNIVYVVIGLVGLAAGARMSVTGAVSIGRKVGLSEAVIGLTIIAIGTSLPELATCAAAAIKGQHDISVGNLVGSNIFNTLLVTGTAGTIRPFEIDPRLIGTDYWIMVIVGVVFALVAIMGRRTISRVRGTLLICGYIAYMIYLFTTGG